MNKQLYVSYLFLANNTTVFTSKKSLKYILSEIFHVILPSKTLVKWLQTFKFSTTKLAVILKLKTIKFWPKKWSGDWVRVYGEMT